MGVLLDTNVWIDIETGAMGASDVAALVGKQPVFASPVVIAEIRFGIGVAASEESRQRRIAALIRIERKPLLPINAGTAHIFGSLAALLHSRGSQPRRRVQNLWIASQAIQHGFALLTRNPGDFAGLPGLDLIPYSLPSPRG